MENKVNFMGIFLQAVGHSSFSYDLTIYHTVIYSVNICFLLMLLSQICGRD